MHERVITLSASEEVSVSPLTLEQFLKQVERRAYRTALLTTRKSADALDIVQDAMLKLVQNYRTRSADEWPLLFQRILQHCIIDWHRQQTRQKKWFWQKPLENEEDVDGDINQIIDDQEQNPEMLLIRRVSIEMVLGILEQLPLRQRQAFILRAWECFSVKETAEVMECNEGSVKTHYFRALQTIRSLLKQDE